MISSITLAQRCRKFFNQVSNLQKCVYVHPPIHGNLQRKTWFQIGTKQMRLGFYWECFFSFIYRLLTNLAVCMSLSNTVSWINTFSIYIFRWSLYTYILWLRVFGNMPSGIQYNWSIDNWACRKGPYKNVILKCVDWTHCF
jgi:hypothetical protein